MERTITKCHSRPGQARMVKTYCLGVRPVYIHSVFDLTQQPNPKNKKKNQQKSNNKSPQIMLSDTQLDEVDVRFCSGINNVPFITYFYKHTGERMLIPST